MEIVGEPLGEGSYGRVYKAVVSTLGTVAVKRLLVHSASNFLFSLREIELGLKFEHPNVLKLREIRTLPPVWANTCPEGHRDDDLCLVYDLADCDLYALCDREDITEDRACNIISQLLLAVEYLHMNNYVHRDIRPANILRFPRDRIKLCDLGFCKKYHTYDEHDPNINAPYFRAPELLTVGIPSGPPADVWAVGCVMHYILSKEVVTDTLVDDDTDRTYTKAEQLQALLSKYPFVVDTTMLQSKTKLARVPSVNVFMKSYTKKLKNVALYTDFLCKLLIFNPRDRITAAKGLTHRYLIKYTPIAIVTREHSVNLNDDNIKYEVCPGAHREIIKGLAIKLFANQRGKADWYSDSVIFMAIDMYDRLLSRNITIRKMSEENHSAYFRSCVYIASKYYTTHITCDLEYKTFPLQECATQTLQCGKDIEMTILELLMYDLYRITLLDEYKKDQRATTRTILALLLFIMEGRHADLTPAEALALWTKDDYKYLTMSATMLKTIAAQRSS